MPNYFIDSREPQNLKSMAAMQHGMQTQELDQGDFYLPSHDVIIERKEASDFASSTTDGRLSEQADRMIAEHEHAYVIIENDIFNDSEVEAPRSLYNLKYSNIQDKSLIGMQTSLAVKRGIKIIYTESEEQTLYAVKRIFERFESNEHEQNTGYVKTADTGEVEDTQVAMLMQIQGISRKKAVAILELYESLSDLAIGRRNGTYESGEVRKETLMQVDGVGPTLAERVINAFQ